jgi:transposase
MNTTHPDDGADPTPAGQLFDLGEPMPKPVAEPAAVPTPRLRLAQRFQGQIRTASVDELLPPDHEVRVVWDYVCELDLTALLQAIRAVPGTPGRNATDPRILLALWLYATLDGVGSARTLDGLCRQHLAYEWLCGGVRLNYHALADFRSQHTAVLDQLLTDSVAALLHENLITLKQVAQDGMRVRASAGAASFRREATLEKCLEEAKEQVEALKNQVGEDSQAASRRQQAARERAARQRQQRIEQALAERLRASWTNASSNVGKKASSTTPPSCVLRRPTRKRRG